MKKILNYIFKGICIGNILSIISYLVIYLVTGNEGLKISLENLLNGNNYIRMVLYSNLGGVLVYLLYGYCYEFVLNERKNQNKKEKYIKVTIFICLVYFYAIIVGLNVFEYIYNEEMFNQIYLLGIMITILCLFGVATFYKLLKSEINWINNNLKKRQ